MPEQTGRYIIDFTDIPAGRPRMPELEVAERIRSFDEVELGFSREAAQQEARRCLSCRRCLGCGLCLAVCQPKAIVFEQQDEIIDITFDDVVISSTADEQMPLKKGEFGYRQYANVLSGLEFEAVLSEGGPYGGMVLRPFDGRIPQKMAFIIAENSMDCIDGVLRQATSSGLCTVIISHDVEDLLFSAQEVAWLHPAQEAGEPSHVEIIAPPQLAERVVAVRQSP